MYHRRLRVDRVWRTKRYNVALLTMVFFETNVRILINPKLFVPETSISNRRNYSIIPVER